MYLKHNSLGDDIPIVVVLKAMGLESDQEIVQLVGSEPEIADLFSGSLEEPYYLGILSQQQALAYIGAKVLAMRDNNLAVAARSTGSHRKAPNPEAEAAEMLANVVLNHVPVEQFNFRAKVIYICHIIRRILFTVRDPNLLDDKV
jgi:DNA-directed RNA polymerase III subunit RPC2